MLGLTWWWAMLLIPAPWLARKFLPPSEHIEAAVQIPLLNQNRAQGSISSDNDRVARASLYFFWICLVLAAGRPYWVAEPTHRVISGRDIMLAIDISGSMQETDMRIGNRNASRIDGLKNVVSTFIDRRRGDRVGLILFGTRAYNYVPLTFDIDTLSELLDDISSGLAGRLTAIGDAIGIAVKTLGEQNSKHKVLILVTDGSNTSGINTPLDAARIAAASGMTIYTIGIGNKAEQMKELLDRSNIDPDSELNEVLLRQIAAMSGGQYFRAQDSESLERIYQSLDRLQPLEIATRLHRPRIALFAWPLGAGMTALLVFMAYRVNRTRETSNR